MTEFHVTSQRLTKFGKHPNADTLSVVQLHGRYPVVFKTSEFKVGDMVVHIPPDALVDTTRPEFDWLADKATNGWYRVKATKLRGVPSLGFITKAPDDCVQEGQDCRELLGVKKYEPEPAYDMNGELQGEFESLPQEGVVPFYDIEGLRRYEKLFTPGEPVVITEKIHGANGRWVYINGRLLCGSRTKFRTNSIWNKLAERWNLAGILSKRPGLVLYGEVYGPGIQDLDYGLKEPDVTFFDAYDTTTGEWWHWHKFENFCSLMGLPYVPILSEGPFDLEAAYLLAEGPAFSGNHVREGIVIKPVYERWDQEVGRVFLKLAGEGFLLRKQNDKCTDGTVQTEGILSAAGPNWFKSFYAKVRDYVRKLCK